MPDLPLTGSYNRTLDDKLRIALPKPLREAFGFPETTTLFIAPGTDQALSLFTAEVLEQIGNAIAKQSPAAKATRAFSRLLYARAQRVEIDRQGRVRLPPELAALAGISAEVVVVGVRDRVEVWNVEAWNEYLQAMQPSYDELAESVFREGFGPAADE